MTGASDDVLHFRILERVVTRVGRGTVLGALYLMCELVVLWTGLFRVLL